jgi:hypothetical protein
MKRLLCLLAFAGCVEAPPVKTTLPMQTLTAPPEATAGDVTVAVEPLTWQSWTADGRIRARLSWREADRNAPIAIGSTAPPPSVVREAEVPIVPLPTFRVRVKNAGAQPLKLDRIELSDGKHKWKPLQSIGDVQGRVEADLLERYPGLGAMREALDGVRSAIAQLPIAQKQLSVPPNGTWEGYLCFASDAHDADELNDLLGAVEKVTLTVGETTLTLPRSTVQKPVMCPGDLKKPSAKKCTDA